MVGARSRHSDQCGGGARLSASITQRGIGGLAASALNATAILATRCGWPLWVNLPLAMAAAGLVALPVALVALRTVEDYFIICTLGMGVILFAVMNNWMELTRGPLGIPGIPPVTVFGHEPTAKWEWVLLAGAFYAAMIAAHYPSASRHTWLGSRAI